MAESIIGTTARDIQGPPGQLVPGVADQFTSLALRLALPEDRTCPLSASCVGAESHVDATVALPASVSRFVAQRFLLAESAGHDLIAPNASLNQRVTNGVDTTLAQTLVVLVGAARIRVAADVHLDGRILLDVRRDVRDLARFVRPNVRFVGIEQDVFERGRTVSRAERDITVV